MVHAPGPMQRRARESPATRSLRERLADLKQLEDAAWVRYTLEDMGHVPRSPHSFVSADAVFRDVGYEGLKRVARGLRLHKGQKNFWVHHQSKEALVKIIFSRLKAAIPPPTEQSPTGGIGNEKQVPEGLLGVNENTSPRRRRADATGRHPRKTTIMVKGAHARCHASDADIAFVYQSRFQQASGAKNDEDDQNNFVPLQEDVEVNPEALHMESMKNAGGDEGTFLSSIMQSFLQPKMRTSLGTKIPPHCSLERKCAEDLYRASLNNHLAWQLVSRGAPESMARLCTLDDSLSVNYLAAAYQNLAILGHTSRELLLRAEAVRSISSLCGKSSERLEVKLAAARAFCLLTTIPGSENIFLREKGVDVVLQMTTAPWADDEEELRCILLCCWINMLCLSEYDSMHEVVMPAMRGLVKNGSRTAKLLSARALENLSNSRTSCIEMLDNRVLELMADLCERAYSDEDSMVLEMCATAFAQLSCAGIRFRRRAISGLSAVIRLTSILCLVGGGSPHSLQIRNDAVAHRIRSGALFALAELFRNLQSRGDAGRLLQSKISDHFSIALDTARTLPVPFGPLEEDQVSLLLERMVAAGAGSKIAVDGEDKEAVQEDVELPPWVSSGLLQRTLCLASSGRSDKCRLISASSICSILRQPWLTAGQASSLLVVPLLLGAADEGLASSSGASVGQKEESTAAGLTAVSATAMAIFIVVSRFGSEQKFSESLLQEGSLHMIIEIVQAYVERLQTNTADEGLRRTVIFCLLSIRQILASPAGTQYSTAADTSASMESTLRLLVSCGRLLGAGIGLTSICATVCDLTRNPRACDASLAQRSGALSLMIDCLDSSGAACKIVAGTSTKRAAAGVLCNLLQTNDILHDQGSAPTIALFDPDRGGLLGGRLNSMLQEFMRESAPPILLRWVVLIYTLARRAWSDTVIVLEPETAGLVGRALCKLFRSNVIIVQSYVLNCFTYLCMGPQSDIFLNELVQQKLIKELVMMSLLQTHTTHVREMTAQILYMLLSHPATRLPMLEDEGLWALVQLSAGSGSVLGMRACLLVVYNLACDQENYQAWLDESIAGALILFDESLLSTPAWTGFLFHMTTAWQKFSRFMVTERSCIDVGGRIAGYRIPEPLKRRRRSSAVNLPSSLPSKIGASASAQEPLPKLESEQEMDDDEPDIFGRGEQYGTSAIERRATHSPLRSNFLQSHLLPSLCAAYNMAKCSETALGIFCRNGTIKTLGLLLSDALAGGKTTTNSSCNEKARDSVVLLSASILGMAAQKQELRGFMQMDSTPHLIKGISCEVHGVSTTCIVALLHISQKSEDGVLPPVIPFLQGGRLLRALGSLLINHCSETDASTQENGVARQATFGLLCNLSMQGEAACSDLVAQDAIALLGICMMSAPDCTDSGIISKLALSFLINVSEPARIAVQRRNDVWDQLLKVQMILLNLESTEATHPELLVRCICKFNADTFDDLAEPRLAELALVPTFERLLAAILARKANDAHADRLFHCILGRLVAVSSTVTFPSSLLQLTDLFFLSEDECFSIPPKSPPPPPRQRGEMEQLPDFSLVRENSDSWSTSSADSDESEPEEEQNYVMPPPRISCKSGATLVRRRSSALCGPSEEEDLKHVRRIVIRASNSSLLRNVNMGSTAQEALSASRDLAMNVVELLSHVPSLIAVWSSSLMEMQTHKQGRAGEGDEGRICDRSGQALAMSGLNPISLRPNWVPVCNSMNLESALFSEKCDGATNEQDALGDDDLASIWVPAPPPVPEDRRSQRLRLMIPRIGQATVLVLQENSKVQK